MKLRSLALAGVVLVVSGGSAHADNHGCTVLLCLANPAGPMAVAECVPPIKKLFRDLARGKSFPSCQLASAPETQGGKTWAQHGVSYYDQCPAGTRALDAGSYAVNGAAKSNYYLGIGEGDEPNGGDSGPLRDKVCVGNRIGDTTVEITGGDGTAALPAGVYDHVIVIAPNAQPYHIDVYVDSRFSHRVRW